MKYQLLFIFLMTIATLSAAQPYQRIVSLSPAATYNLMELGCEDKIVGVTSYCDLANNQDLVVSSAISMNMEKVLMLEPDVVIYTTMFKPNQIKRLESLGIRTELFASPKNFAETCDQFIRLGSLVDKHDEALVYIDSCKQLMSTIQAQMPSNSTPSMFIEIGAKPLFGAIPNTFMHDYIEVLGGQNIAEGQSKGTFSREFVLRSNPDMIFIVTMGIVSEKEKLIWESYPELEATKKKQIYVVDASLACRPTPHNFVNTVIEMNRLMYGE